MTPEEQTKLEQLEARLRQGMDAAKEKGFKIVRGVFLLKDEKCCCAIGACKVTDPTEIRSRSPMMHTIVAYATMSLAMSMDQTTAFMDGFDNLSTTKIQPRFQPYYDLGQKLGKEYVG